MLFKKTEATKYVFPQLVSFPLKKCMYMCIIVFSLLLQLNFLTIPQTRIRTKKKKQIMLFLHNWDGKRGLEGQTILPHASLTEILNL